MKAVIFILFITFVSSIALAKKEPKRKPSNDTGMEIIQVDPDFPIDEMQEEGINVLRLQDRAKRSEALPPSIQKGLLFESGIHAYVASWDAYEKDLFVLRVEHQAGSEVRSKYEDQIPLENILKLKKSIQKYRSMTERE